MDNITAKGLTFNAIFAILMPVLAVYKFVMLVLIALSFRSANEKGKTLHFYVAL
ncbi:MULTISPECIES: hypothetical protein [Leclercia]|uniref:hypothetical protein n=1 Tax=Leclercia TaxID=83654 RepID=UPI00133115E8|nr:hypothetical protein [Leclercia adecarboxylata]